jgi:hypothetical protein
MGEVERLAQEYRDAVQEARALFEGNAARALARRPAPNKWSAAECLEHLNITSRAHLGVLRPAFEELRKLPHAQDGKSYRMELAARLLKKWLEPPSRLGLPAPPGFVPPVDCDPEVVCADFAKLQDELLALLKDAQGLPLDRVKIPSPFAQKVKYNVWSALVLLVAHQRRHLWQARRAVQSG